VSPANIRNEKEKAMKLVSCEEMKECVDTNCAVIIDARSESDFAAGHIRGAVNIPAENVREKISQKLQDKDQRVITYCGSTDCPRSKKAADALEDLGYTNVGAFEGGVKEWQEAGFPLEGSASRQAAA
jgi:rhodanese-related sulfurtransferase